MKKVRFGGRLLAALLLPFVVVACSDTTGLEENHGEEIEGVQIWLSGAMIASYDGDTGSWTGELEVHEGEETAHMDIRMVDHDGVEVELEADHYLEVDVEDESIAEFEQDTPGEFGGHLHGVAVGETDVVFKLMHGAVGSGHADFVTAAVHAHVEDH
ncbi:MAG TPA: hypothetical protein DEB33_00895 [Gemmatimonadetes bacterium]|jgi:hypothetical protein|nr:hypothetical protein [Gemmatimonadota bacterium]|tara:strand:- start:528 stop:998 length:471 start_codon:yes stop_codon:yes gene_type:complete